MKISEQIIPEDYEPYEIVDFCGTRLENVQYLIQESNGFIPLLIGKGVIPKIWLYGEGRSGDLLSLVERSISRRKGLSVDIDIDRSEINIKIDSEIYKTHVLTLTYDDEQISISYIDLEVVSYNIHGDSEKIVIGLGQNKIVNSVIRNTKAFLIINS